MPLKKLCWEGGHDSSGRALEAPSSSSAIKNEKGKKLGMFELRVGIAVGNISFPPVLALSLAQRSELGAKID